MSVIKNTVFLFKSEESETVRDKYRDILEASKFEVKVVKTLIFEYKNIEILREKLLNPDRFSGIILMSPRCVNAVSQAVDAEQMRLSWTAKLNFTVGVATYNELLEKLELECKGKESGNAKNLSQVIVKNAIAVTRPFLFPHGNLRTDTMKLELEKANLQLEEVLVYDTLPNPHIGKDLKDCTNGFSNVPEFLVFFSPSGFHSSIEHLRRMPVDLGAVKIIAIGPLTQLAIEEQNLKVYNVAKSPTPEEVLNALLQ